MTEETQPDNFQCTKCRDLDLMTQHFEGYVADLCSGFRPMVLEPMSCRDYLIILRLVSRHLHTLSDRHLLSIQRLLPMSIQGLVDQDRSSNDHQINCENLMDEACMNIVANRLRDLISSMFQTEDKLRLLDNNAILKLEKECHLVRQTLRNMIHSNGQNTKLARLKYWKAEVIDKVDLVLTKLYQTKNRECLAQFAQLLVDTGLITGMPAETQLANLLCMTDDAFERISTNYLSYQREVSKRLILKHGVNDLVNYSMQRTVLESKWYAQLPPLVKSLVENFVESIEKELFKPYAEVNKADEILGAIKSNLQLLYFSFSKTVNDLEQLIEMNIRISDWYQRATYLDQRLRAVKEISETDLLSNDRRSEMLVSVDEFKKVFSSNDQREHKFLKHLPKYKSLKEIDYYLSSEGDEVMTFAEVMEEINNCYPLTPSRMAVIEEEALRFRVDKLQKHKISVTENELALMVSSLPSRSEQDKARLAYLKRIQSIMAEVMSDSYPESVSVELRQQDLNRKKELLSKVLIGGNCKEKLRRLTGVSDFVTEVEKMLHSQGINRSVAELLEGGIQALADIDWSKIDSLGKSLFFRNKYLSLFPEIEAFVQRVYTCYLNYLVGQASTHGEKTDISNILLIETIYYYLKEKPELNQIYKKRRDNLLAILRGSIEMMDAKNLTLLDMKSRIEALQDRMKHLKGFNEDKRSKIGQAFHFINQLEVIALLLRRVKVFLKEDVNMKNRDMYRAIAQAVRNPSLLRLPLASSELNCEKLKDFIQYFDQIDKLMDEWITIKDKISEARCILDKTCRSRCLSDAIMCIFELPDKSIGERLERDMGKYVFLNDMAQWIRQQLRETECLQEHLEDDERYKKVTEGIEQFKSSSTRLELQQYLLYLLKHRLVKLGFTNKEINTLLKFYWVFNKLTGLLYEKISLTDLETKYRDAISSTKCDNIVKLRLKNMRILSTIEDRINKANELSNQLSECQGLTAERYFQLLSDIRNSKVTFGDTKLENYLTVMSKIEKVYFSSRGTNLAAHVSLEEYQYSTNSLPVPIRIEEFVYKHLKEQVDYQKWMHAVLNNDHPRKAEVDTIIDISLMHTAEHFRDLQELQAHQEALLNKLSTEVERLLLSSLGADSITFDSVKKVFYGICGLKYFCDSDQLILLVKLFLWTLKESKLLEKRNEEESSKMLISLQNVELLAEMGRFLKAKLQIQDQELLLKTVCRPKDPSDSQRTVDQSERTKNSDTVLEILEKYIEPVEQLYQKMIEVSVQIKKHSIADLLVVCNRLRDLGLPDQTISILNKLSLVEAQSESTEASPAKILIENELLDSLEHPVKQLELVDRIHLDDLISEIEELLIHQKTQLYSRLNNLVKAAEFVKQGLEEKGSQQEVSATVSTDRKKATNKKVTAIKQVNNRKNRSDQKENQIVAKGKQSQTGKKSLAAIASRKNSNDSLDENGTHEQKTEKVAENGESENSDAKQLRKRKPDIVKTQKTDSKVDKKKAKVEHRHVSGQRVAMFDSLTLRTEHKTFENKKVTFFTQQEGLDEATVNELSLKGHLDLHLYEMESSARFEYCKSLIRKEEPIIYGCLHIRNNNVGDLLEKSPLWEGYNERIGRVWIFKENHEKEFVREYDFLPNTCTTSTNSYMVFILEKRIDGKEIDSSAVLPLPRRAKHSSPDNKKLGSTQIDDSFSRRASKSRSIKEGGRNVRSRKGRR